MSTDNDIDKAFEDVISDLQKYSNDKINKIMRIARKIGRQALLEIELTSPKDSGEYAENWGIKYDTKTDDVLKIRINQKLKPSLTHLLEEGHVSRDGKTKVRAYRHIKKVEDNALEELNAKVEEILKR